MAYTAPTIADFRARFPRFTESVVVDATVQYALDRGSRNVDETWTEGDYSEAIMLYAAGWLTTQGLGGGAEAEAAAAGASGFKVMKSGALSLERFDNGSGGAAGGGDPVLATADGQAFATLRQQNVGGPRVTGGGYPAACYGDWPWPC